MKRFLSFAFVCFATTVMWAQPATGYYDSANNKKGTSLLQALSDIIDNHTVISYDNLEDYYPDIDARIDDPSLVWDIYSTCEFTFNDANCSQKQVCDCWNKEHTVPQSWFSGTSGMKSDLFHVLPTDARVNNFRGNLPYGEVSDHSSPVCDDSRALGWRSSSAFEPIDEFKGDIARIYFYVATRYDENCTSWSGGMFGSGNNGFKSSVAEMLLKWHRNDPVSEKELLRNNAVAKVQKNRNPFVDYPCLAEYIWGEYSGQSVDFSRLLSAYSDEYASATDKSGCECDTDLPTILTPKAGTSINIGASNLNETITKQVLISGRNLIGNVTLAISGTNASYFSISTNSISATAANNGYNVTVSYLPKATGNHTAILTVSSQDATTVTVNLTGSCTSSIISPTGTLYFETNDATETLEEDIVVKGTNLTSGVTLALSGSSKFSLSKTSLTADEAKVGTSVRVTYVPTEVGRDTAKLVTSSGAVSTTTYFVGECRFEALEATDLTQNSFVANWTNAGTDGYSLDVYTKEINGTAEVVLLQDECNKATTATTSGGVYYDVENCVRLGSGSKIGAITYSSLDLSKGGKVIVNAQYYNNDAGTQMKISAGDVSETFTIVLDFVDYEMVVPANDGNTSVDVKIESLKSGARVNVNNVQVITGGEMVVNQSIVGYPKSVGNVQSYWVEGVDLAQSDYYYTVTPFNSAVSNEIFVSAENVDQTTVDEILSYGMKNYRIGNCWIVEGVAPESVLTLMSTSGVVLERTVARDSSVRFTLPMHGVYLLRVESNGNAEVLKTVY